MTKFHTTSLKFYFFIAFVFYSTLAFGQSGKDGALTVSTSNTVLNRYTRVTSDIPIGSNSLTVVNINELNRDGITYLPAGYTTNASSFVSNALQAGDLILLFQAQGAVINTTNSLNYGEVTNLNNAGRYEMAYVGSVSGNTITLECNTRFAYFAANYVQCIRIPQYTTLTVNSGASVVPIRWGDPAFGGADPSAETRRRGGFLGIHADYIVNDGSINANFAGFRGGTFFNGSPTEGDVYYSDYFYSATFRAGEKGEGIAGYRPDYDAMGGRYGMGAPANAGGGGNGHNCGGGGGANGGDPAGWFRGAGVMNDFGTCGNPGAWALDPNYIANGNALTSSTGGGRGGYSYSASNGNACTSGPSYPANFISPGVPLTNVLTTAAWGGDRRKALGGLGGRPLVSPAIDRQIFYGGGGGAGDGNNNASSDGGDGGGIVFLIVENSVSGSGVIQANGEAGSNTRGATGNDAPGGGGAGGTILVQASSISAGIAINANGGNGGTQTINLGTEGEGPGGGGGGGAIYMNAPSDASTKTVNGGANGTTNSLGTTEFIANGATSGNVGSLRTTSVEINHNYCLADLEIIKTVNDLTPTFGDNITFTLTASNLGQNDANNVVVNDLLPSGYTFVSSNPSVGTYNEITGVWAIGSLNYPSSSETLEIVATVNLTGTYANTAIISADEPDPEPDNDTSTVTPVPSNCNAGPASSSPSGCVNTSMTPITHATTTATGIGTPTGLPAGVTASWSADVITISGTPTVSGTFNYSIPLITTCGTEAATGTITVTINSVSSPPPTFSCVNTALTPIILTTTLATGIGTPTGLPSGVSASWSSNEITISGTPTVAGTYNYSIPLTGGCGTVNATGTLTITSTANTVSAASSSPNVCINVAITVTHTTTAATGIGTPTGLPTGVLAVWSSNTITIFGAPTSAGVFNYSIPLTGGCGTVNATGTITVRTNTVTAASSSPTLCINTALTPITHTTTGATGISGVTGLPNGVTAAWASNTITISGTPTQSGVRNYSIQLTGGCGVVLATGTITVDINTVASASNPSLCINTPLTAINRATTGATGIANDGVSGANGLPTGISATWSANVLTISGTPTVSGIFTYSIPLTGGCGTVNATGTITVNINTSTTASSTPTLCVNTALTPITHTTTRAGGRNSSGTGLPPGVSSTWSSNTLTISGTPTAVGVYNYSILLTGGCGTVYSTGTITVVSVNTLGSAPANPTVCINSALTPLTRTTGAATGISNDGVSGANGLPTGVSASWSANVITISGTPTVSGTFNYSIPLTGGCGSVTSDGTITVIPSSVSGTISGGTTVCNGTNSTTLTLSGNTGTIQWQSSTNDITYNNIIGETTATYTATNLSATTYYKAVVTNGVCGAATTSAHTITVVNPSISDPSLASGDFIWRGSDALSTDSVDWLVPSNWYVYDGVDFNVAATLPTKLINVFIPGVGTCFKANPHIFTSTAPESANLTILSSGHLTMHTGKLSVAGNWVNNGIFTCGTGEVIFIEEGYHTIGGTVSVNAFYDFRMNKPADGPTKSVAYLLKQATIAGKMTLDIGLFDINVFSIDMDDREVIGGSNASYVRTSDVGFLRRYVGSAYDNMQSGYVRFPVGRSNFNQARLNNSGTSDKFSVRLFDNVSDDSEEASPTTALPVVVRTWIIDEQTTGGSDVDMQLYWNGTITLRDEELNAFDYNTAYIAHYDASSPTWENKGGSAPSGPGYAQQNGITSFSPFTISSRWGLGYISPLPVELLDFTATCLDDKSVQIDWSTASENNSSHFEVRKSLDGYTWNTIESVLAAGNSTELLEYSILDRSQTKGNTYYRLNQIDIDGKSELFDVVTSNCVENELNNALTTYPNPSSNEFFVEFNSEDIEGEATIEITDSRGVIVYTRKVQLEKGTNFFTIGDIKTQQGIYYLYFKSDGFKSNVVKQVIR
jgi:uncharacterized repeat protein (TIGR01451 family)